MASLRGAQGCVGDHGIKEIPAGEGQSAVFREHEDRAGGLQAIHRQHGKDHCQLPSAPKCEQPSTNSQRRQIGERAIAEIHGGREEIQLP